MNSPINFGFMPGGFNTVPGLQNAFGANMFGTVGAHQWVADRVRKKRQQAGAGAAQNVAMNVASPDANSVSATGFNNMGGEMYADPSAQLATGNAPNNTITAGMAMGNAPIATIGGFNPETTSVAEGIYGTETDRATSMNPRKLITL
tara:strand:+ start:80 stop:520 length:441 start_codon:yes stop_codon:yes gene_type:complete